MDSLKELKNEEQRRVLQTVAEIRKCGLDSVLSLPQFVVCGMQSAGKSSVLEAVTGIPFPRSDNMCTRFATEIILKREPIESLTVRLIPDPTRPSAEQDIIRNFHEEIADLSELSTLITKATSVMEIGVGGTVKPFSRDVLSIEIGGPARPQLTLVDIPGIIETTTKGITQADIDLVNDITEEYISQPRTICLAVVSAASDYATQKILTKVRKFDPEGDRTLGIITKPDRVPKGSGSETAYVELAQNRDIFFKLGWHVLKNRAFEEEGCSFAERDLSEMKYLMSSGFKCLSVDCLGVESLRTRLSQLLFEHVRKELPKLRQDLDQAFDETTQQLTTLGRRRFAPPECRAYLTQLSLDYYEICKAAINGHYEGEYFSQTRDEAFSLDSSMTLRRIRAVVQHENMHFSEKMRASGHKFQLDLADDSHSPPTEDDTDSESQLLAEPIYTSKAASVEWVRKAMLRARGRELIGDFNPLLIGELFWEQSCKWASMAEQHVERITGLCNDFLRALLEQKCPSDIYSRLWSGPIEQALQDRIVGASRELKMIMDDHQNYPINYNHYYTDIVSQTRLERQKESLRDSIEAATTRSRLKGWPSDHTSASIDVEAVVNSIFGQNSPNMEEVSCMKVLDGLMAIYKVQEKLFVANVTTQVVERHVIRGLEKIFSPVAVSHMGDAQVSGLASEPASTLRQRLFLEDRSAKLRQGQGVIRKTMGGGNMPE